MWSALQPACSPPSFARTSPLIEQHKVLFRQLLGAHLWRGVARGWVPQHSTVLYSMTWEDAASRHSDAMKIHGRAPTEQT